MSRIVVFVLSIAVICFGVTGCGDDSPTDPGGGGGGASNQPPAAPEINTGAGAPADGSTGRPVTSLLHWTCSDPDGDALTYDVSFGTSATPPAVSTAQSAESYNPGTLAYSTTYYWQVVAEDPDGETAGSAVWSFTTMAQPSETVNTPDTPTGAVTTNTGDSESYSTGGSTSSSGHTVEYRFDWGDGSYSTWAAATDASHSWSGAGTYSVRAQSRCGIHTAVESPWSAAVQVVVTDAAETVATPGNVSGPATGGAGQSLAYQVPLATSSIGHVLEYRFDWGDGSISVWSTSNGASHSWTAAGSYEIKAQARCRDHTSVVSDWTAAFAVTISVVSETVSRPTITSFPANGAVGETQDFYSNYASSSEFHALEHRYDYGDGTIGDWSTSRAGAHAYAATGSYEVRAQARCAQHTAIESEWSNAVTVQITDTETLTTPVINPATELTIPANQQSTTMLASVTSSVGHPVQVNWDWGDGQTSGWVSAGIVQVHTWTAIGDYNIRVQARCGTHNEIVTEWSAPRLVHVTEAVSQPSISGPGYGNVGVPVSFSTSGAASSEGHDLEYRLYISTSYSTVGSPQAWTTADNLTYTFNSARTWYVRVQARCIADQTESIVSMFHSIIINP